MPSFRSAPLLLALLAINCRDATAPQPSLEVSLTSSIPTHFETETADGLLMHCNVTLTAIAKGNGVATWQDGVARFYLGASRTAPVDSQAFTIEDVRGAWGRTITQRDRPQTNWSFTGSVPFEVEIEQRYATDGSAVIVPAKIRFGCGPSAAPGTYAAPVVSQVDVTPTTGELQPGGGIDVTYTATSSYPMWSTTVLASGPFLVRRVFAEAGATTVTRTVHLTVPTGAVKGSPISITVMAQDGALQQGGRTVQTQAVVMDRTPPVLSNLYNLATSRLSGQSAVGDSLRFLVTATDNDRLSWLIWELGAPANVRDSMPVPNGGAATTWVASLAVKPDWVGAPIMSFRVRDASGLESTVLKTAQDSMRFYPLVTRPATLPAIATSTTRPVVQLGDLAYDAKRNVFYVVLAGTSEIGVLDVPTMTFRTSISIVSNASGLDLTPSGDSLIIAIPATRTLAVVNLAQPSALQGSISLTMLDTVGGVHAPDLVTPSLVRVAANGRAVVTLDNRIFRSNVRILTVDLATGTPLLRTDANITNPYGVANAGATPDRSRVLLYDFGCPRSYVAATDSFTACGARPSLGASRGFTFDAVGQRTAVDNGAFDLDFHLLRSCDAINGWYPSSAISSDGTTIYLGASQTVSTMRISDGVLTERFNIPITAQRLFMSPAGDWLVAFQSDDGLRATRIDLR